MLSDDKTDQRHWNEANYFDLNAGIRLQLLQPSDMRRGSDNDDFVCVCDFRWLMRPTECWSLKWGRLLWFKCWNKTAVTAALWHETWQWHSDNEDFVCVCVTSGDWWGLPSVEAWNEADYFDLSAGIRLQLLQPSDSRRGSDNDDFVCVCVTSGDWWGLPSVETWGPLYVPGVQSGHQSSSSKVQLSCR